MKMNRAILLLFALCLPLQAADVVFQYENIVGQSGVHVVTLKPIGAPWMVNGKLIVRNPYSSVTDRAGSLTVSNFVGGKIESDFVGDGQIVTTNYFDFPFTNGTLYATNYLTTTLPGGTNVPFYSAANLVFRTNLTSSTSNGVVFVDSVGGSVGGSGLDTNAVIGIMALSQVVTQGRAATILGSSLSVLNSNGNTATLTIGGLTQGGHTQTITVNPSGISFGAMLQSGNDLTLPAGGNFYGGLPAANLSGTVPLGSLSGITSNQFDIGTAAQLALAGTGSGVSPITVMHGTVATSFGDLESAAAAAITGDSIVLSPGTFYISHSIQAPTNGAIVGAGRRASIIASTKYGTSLDIAIRLSDNCTIQRLTVTNTGIISSDGTLTGTPYYGGCIGTLYSGVNYSNAVLADCDFYGLSDTWYNRSGSGNNRGMAINCKFVGGWDIVTAFAQEATPVTNFFKFYDCQFLRTHGIGEQQSGADLTTSTETGSFLDAELYDCQFRHEASGIYIRLEGPPDNVRCYNCTFTNTTGAVDYISYEGGTHNVLLQNCSMPPGTVYFNGGDTPPKPPSFGGLSADRFDFGSGDWGANASVTSGADAPTAAEADGSIYLRGTGQLYLMTDGTWQALGSGGGATLSQLQGSTNTATLALQGLATQAYADAKTNVNLAGWAGVPTNSPVPINIWGKAALSDYLGTNSGGQIVFSNAVVNTNLSSGSWALYNASQEVRSNYSTGSYFQGTNGSAKWVNGANAASVIITNGGITASGGLTGATVSAQRAAFSASLTLPQGDSVGEFILGNASGGRLSLSNSAIGTMLTIDDSGNVSAHGIFSGGGSGLTNLTAANIAAGTAPISISGNSATATSASTINGFQALTNKHSVQVEIDAAQTNHGTFLVDGAAGFGSGLTIGAGQTINPSSDNNGYVGGGGRRFAGGYFVETQSTDFAAPGFFAMAAGSPEGQINFFGWASGLKNNPIVTLNVSNIVARGTITATNGYILPQLPWIPTNSIPGTNGSANNTVTNWILVNLSNNFFIGGTTYATYPGGPTWICTNSAVSGGFILKQPSSWTTTTVP